ncbi:hypothetical protein AMK21_15375 [Streptomyces sp. CB00316]|uniref:hypothetical protein n=1 Tax=Streptomyces sp. CB00316 TaxID=1703932 RepID=UPI00093BAED8|nr:hypothetical protein [Streptomyces sp. CB00316]OKJ19729.1 hypothetical protein AMK21_15375 [Streptomyces sp. CB00316]
MTTPPQPPQGPYGPPPHPQQNPYAPSAAAAPGAPPQPPYGYPQQPPAPPRQGGGWGQPGIPGGGGPGVAGWPPQGPGAQPPRKRRTGLIAGIVAGAVVLAGGIAFGVSQLVGKTADAAFPDAEYKLVLEQKLLDGEFTLAQDLSSTEGKKIEKMYDPTVRDARAVVGQYSSAEGGALVISGMYGRFTSPEAMTGKMMDGGSAGDGATVVVPPTKFTPAGFDITMECQVLQSVKGGVQANIPMCAWGDDNTGVSVGIIRARTALQDPSAIDLEAAAVETAKVREEIRRPIG